MSLLPGRLRLQRLAFAYLSGSGLLGLLTEGKLKTVPTRGIDGALRGI